MAKFEQILIELFGNILKQSFKNYNKNGEYASYRRRYSLALFSSCSKFVWKSFDSIAKSAKFRAF